MNMEVVEKRSEEAIEALAIIEYKEGTCEEYLMYSAEKGVITRIDIETLKKAIDSGILVSPHNIGVLSRIQKKKIEGEIVSEESEID